MEKYSLTTIDEAVEKTGDSVIDNVSYEKEVEESGWTDYFEDFSSEIERQSSFCSSIGSSSSVSWRLSNHGNDDVVSSKKLCFKKLTRTQKILGDDSLEDTATSPVHSPKVSDLRERSSNENPRFEHMMITSSLESERLSENYYQGSKEKRVELVSFVHAS